MIQRSIQVAAVQMDVSPARLDQRLSRADLLVCDAVELGADLVVLPELFNTGYVYSDENFQSAEPADGMTLTWLKKTAKRHHVHLAGSLLLLDGGEIFNAMFIVSPDGRTWRYDKSYPWGWERGYFREARAHGVERAVVAHTDLGDLGMLICWDVAHPELWQAYAGKVDMMVICSSPPQMTNLNLLLPGGSTLSSADLGAMLSGSQAEGQRIFGAVLDQQAAWLGVPAANSTGCGLFESALPNGTASLLALIPGKPSLARYLPVAGQIKMSAKIIEACKVIDGHGKTMARIPQSRGEAFAIADVPLADSKPQPGGPQPETHIPRSLYTLADTLLPRVSHSTYEHGIKRLRAD